jgi:hypothetical protein
MSAGLARNWWAIGLRGAVAILLGLTLLALPRWTTPIEIKHKIEQAFRRSAETRGGEVFLRARYAPGPSTRRPNVWPGRRPASPGFGLRARKIQLA